MCQLCTAVVTHCCCTRTQVGPGSYAVLETSKQQKHQGPSAAFAWAGKRCTVPSAAQAAAEDLASTALDQAAGSIRPWANNNATSSFSSATQRFLLNKEAAAKPGYVTQQAAYASCKGMCSPCDVGLCCMHQPLTITMGHGNILLACPAPRNRV